jgi:hypothetical protein
VTSCPTTNQAAPWRWAAAECLLILLLCFLYAGWPAPAVNEAHYLAKAKHYWAPTWCAGDAFLESADVHVVFYWSFGWLTRLLPLPAVAWIGRFLTWGLLAWAWQRLSWAVVPQRWFSVLAAALLLLFSQRFNMAGEWVVGGVEAKGFAYVCVLLALESLLRQRWRVGWIWLGTATAFHVLVGGWSWVAAGCAWLSCRQLRPPLRRLAPGILVGLLLALIGLWPALMLNRGVSPELAREANCIYVYGRLSHHLLFHAFPREFILRQAVLLLIWLAACWASPCQICRSALGQRPLRGFVGGAVAIALVGIAIDQSLLNYPEWAAGLLRYYWFRLSDVLLPVGTALALVDLIHGWRDSRPVLARWALATLIGCSGASLAITNLQRCSDLRPGADQQGLPTGDVRGRDTWAAYEEWRRACTWIAQHTPADARFITPREQQTFKWYASRSEVCSWKDLPQDAAALVDWWQRHQEIYPRAVIFRGLAAHGEAGLVELAHKYGAQYVLVDRYLGHRPLLLPRVYPDRLTDPQVLYEVYRVPDSVPK